MSKSENEMHIKTHDEYEVSLQKYADDINKSLTRIQINRAIESLGIERSTIGDLADDMLRFSQADKALRPVKGGGRPIETVRMPLKKGNRVR